MRFLLVLLFFTSWLSAEAVSPMKLVIKTFIANENFTLGLISGESYNATIKWGDGNSQTITTSTSPIHKYATAGTYTITITGASVNTFPGVRFYNGSEIRVYELLQWGNHKWTSLNGAFFNCSNMKITATDAATANTGSVTDFNNAFFGCSGMTSFPPIDTSSATSLYQTWSGCTGLTSFPLINTSAATTLTRTWSGCTGLTTFPLINTSAAVSLYQTWSGCSKLTSFPLIDTSAVKTFEDTWKNCLKLISFPLINTSAATTLTRTWSGCSGLTSFPLINTSAATTLIQTWAMCSGLTSFPLINTSAATQLYRTWEFCPGLINFPMIDTSAATDLSGAWSHCFNLASFPAINTSSCINFSDTWFSCTGIQNFPKLNFNAMVNGNWCFSYVTIPTATYNAMLIDMATNNPNSNVTFHGGNSRYSSAATAARETTLPITKSWNITDGGITSPVITSSIAANGKVGASFTYQITASDGPLLSFTATGLPTGLSINTSTGLISGTPTNSGLSSVTLTATNAFGTGPGKTLTLAVSTDGTPVITSPSAVTAVRGQFFHYKIEADGYPTYNAIGIPANGLSFIPTGDINGTPQKIGSMVVMLQATDLSGNTSVKQLTITVVNPGGSGGGTPSGGGGGGGGCGVGSGMASLVLLSLFIAWMNLARAGTRSLPRRAEDR